MDPGCLDHSPLSIKFEDNEERESRPFKFLNHLVEHKEFLTRVKEPWQKGNGENKMKDVWCKLKRVKHAMKELNKAEYNEVNKKINRCRHQLTELQEQMKDPGQKEYMIMVEKDMKAQLEKWLEVEESIMKQKSKVNWLKLGDGNTTYFHASMKNRCCQNKIKSLTKANEVVVQSKQETEEEVLGFYKQLLGSSDGIVPTINPVVMRDGTLVNRQQQLQLMKDVSKEEVYNALLGIGDNKAPGYGEFNALFYKKAWPMIGEEVTEAVMDFFINSELYQPINCTTATLVPK
uniref:Uncharacterized protein n=1 Tax=Nicotiana tabacum TaxID=4097 RepID=A0A1S3ZI61_TOBAC